MRKILIVVLIIILLFVGYLMLFNGINIFGWKVLSITQVKQESEALDSKLEQVSTLTSTVYPKAIKELNDSTKQLLIEKGNYADLVSYSSSEDVTSATQLEKYEVEYLWAKIGNHATKKGVTLKLDIKTSSQGTPNQYDLTFTATGKYVSISEFIAALEDDSSLAFKIEDFKLAATADSKEILQGSFNVKDVAINIDKISSGTTTNNNTTNTNTTNTTNTNSVSQNTTQP